MSVRRELLELNYSNLLICSVIERFFYHKIKKHLTLRMILILLQSVYWLAQKFKNGNMQMRLTSTESENQNELRKNSLPKKLLSVKSNLRI